MKKIAVWLTALCITAGPAVASELPTAEAVLGKIDQNMVFTTAHAQIDMVITINNRTITKQMESFALGNEKSFIEFHSPARDKGTKMLKIGDIVKVYYPSAERILRISGHLLRQSMMGSDFSYEDMTERATRLREEYAAKIEGQDEIDGTPCYLLVLTSKLERQTYFTRKAWVDMKRYVVLKEELYAKSGKLLKVLFARAIESIDNRFYPTRVVMEDKLRGNSRTEMIITKLEIDISIPEDTFGERRLMKK